MAKLEIRLTDCINEATRSYLQELALDIAANGGFGARSPIDAVREAHGRRQAFLQEMLDNRTDRARMAREVLTAEVYGQAVLQSARERGLEHCEHIADATFRRALYER